MSKFDVSSSCPCGTKIDFKVKKPTRFTPTLCKVTCPKCTSRFLFTYMVDTELPGREYKYDIAVVRLSHETKELLAGRIKARPERAV